MLMVDPRLRMSGAPSVGFTSVTDDAGNVLWNSGPIARNRNMLRSQFVMTFASTLKMPEKPGKRIASAKGEALYTVALEQDVAELEQAEKKQGETIAVGSTQVRVVKIEVTKRDVITTHIDLTLERSSTIAAPTAA